MARTRHGWQRDVSLSLFWTQKPAIAMLQLSPLPGSARYQGESLDAIVERALAEAQVLVDAGFDGLQLQNMGDQPGTSHVGPETVACMTAVAIEVRRAFPAVSLSVLVNWDGEAGIAVAVAAAADFARIEHTFVGAAVTSWGLSESCCHQVMRLRNRMRSSVPVFADVMEPHGVQLVPRPVEDLARAAVADGGAEGLYASGHNFTESLELLRRIKTALPDIPLLLGGGATPENVADALAVADGVTVANWIKRGDLRQPAEGGRAKAFMRAVRRAREAPLQE